MAREFESVKGYKPNARAGEPITTGEMQHFMDFVKFLYHTKQKSQPRLKGKLAAKYDSFFWG